MGFNIRMKNYKNGRGFIDCRRVIRPREKTWLNETQGDCPDLVSLVLTFILGTMQACKTRVSSKEKKKTRKEK